MKKWKFAVTAVLGMALVFGAAMPAFAAKAEAKPEAFKAGTVYAMKAEAKPEV
ncbi:hypothetical protein [Paenibacillus soyae]|uniref:Uncharacterized protein n=1 Tax=Paenibacillus soyae TaxID=2969249 RepID=A0A9X2MXX9_9BACL|nr:hypothetical protein [Paenibacillus soyae]MCR2805482.1 hypothetical protein [Paenibacillus soyae]